MSEIDTGHEQTGWRSELKLLLREPPLLISIVVIFAIFGFFIIYPFFKLLLVPTAADWMKALKGKEFIQAFTNTLLSSLAATTAAIIIGFIFAYAINYTAIHKKRFFQIVKLLPT